MPLEEKLKRLQDRIDISETMYSYCNYADLLDAKRMASLFTDDCHVSYSIDAKNDIKGRDALYDYFSAYFSEVASQSHYITNKMVFFETEDSVLTQMYMHSWQRFKEYPDRKDVLIWGRYQSRFVRVNEVWRISNLRLRTAGSYGRDRIGEQLGLPFPPVFN